MNKEQLHDILRFDIPNFENRDIKIDFILSLQPTDKEVLKEAQRRCDNTANKITGQQIKIRFVQYCRWFKNFKR